MATALNRARPNLARCREGAPGSPGDQIGYKGQEELNDEYEPGVKWNTFTPELASPLAPGSNFCPNGSKIGTVKIKTPLLEHELEGAVYLAAQDANPFGSLVAMYIVAEDPYSGSLIKLAGEVSLNPDTGQIVTTFKNTPDVPFENLELHFFGGERAPLSTPSRCGTYTTTAVFTPWDGNGPVTAESSFNIEHGPNGSPCPGATLPFNPTVNAGATNIQAGAFSPLTVTMNRKDGEQNLKSVEAKLPPGLSGVLTGVELCPEPQANEGLCGETARSAKRRSVSVSATTRSRSPAGSSISPAPTTATAAARSVKQGARRSGSRSRCPRRPARSTSRTRRTTIPRATAWSSGARSN